MEMTDEPRYKEKDWLERKYIKENLDQEEIGDIVGCSGRTISNWLEKYDIKYPYQKKKVLKRMYIDMSMSCGKIADELGCADTTIFRYLKKFDIETRNSPSQKPPNIFTDADGGGYETIQSCGDKVFIHRLLATLKYDLEEMEGMLVHHRNHVPWDNRLDNFELMSDEDHMSHHSKSGKLWKNCPSYKKRENLDLGLVKSMWENGCEYKEIANKVGYHEDTIGRIVRNEIKSD